MSRGSEFVEQWIQENVHPEAYVDENGGDPRPRRLAQSCIADAKVAGISRSELEEDIGNLEDHMAQAIDAAADAEVDRLVAKES